MTGSTTPIDRAQRMRAAMAPVLEAGPEFLAGRREADDMARTMVAAALAAAEGEVEAGEAGDPEERTPSPEVVADTRRLQAAWEEIHTCGSVQRLDVFGSFARGEATASSDVDLLYTLRPGVRLGWAIEDLAAGLADILGHPVDLVERRALHERMEAAVLAEAEVLYAA